jgi:hypothetical protein
MDETKKEVIFADGFIFKKPREGAPSFVKGSLSIKADKAIAFIKAHMNEKRDGWINLDLKQSRDSNRLYLQLDTFVPKKRDDGVPDSW